MTVVSDAFAQVENYRALFMAFRSSVIYAMRPHRNGAYTMRWFAALSADREDLLYQPPDHPTSEVRKINPSEFAHITAFRSC